MTRVRKDVGDSAERLAELHLQRQGYVIRSRNWRCRSGEIDLVAEREGVLVFVEVRARRSAAMGTAAESLTPRKRAHLLAAVAEYEAAAGELPEARRIDLVTVDRIEGRMVLEQIESAVELG